MWTQIVKWKTSMDDTLHFLRRIRTAAALATVALVGAACGMDTSAPSARAATHVRVINALFQANDNDTIPVAIDYVIDSASGPPSALAIPAVGHSAGDSANGYMTLASGVHNYIARRAGDTALTASLYTTTTDLPYLPKQFLSPGIYYTAVVAGIVPGTGPVSNNTIPFVFLVDDPYAGPLVDNVVEPRFRVVNAAPYAATSGNGAIVSVYVTPGSTPPANITQSGVAGTARYRSASPYINVDPGPYVITLRASNVIVSQQSITLSAGEVRTLILQSTASGAPSMGNHIVTNVLDHQY